MAQFYLAKCSPGEVVAATRLPVNADFLNGFADEPDGIRASALEVER